METTPASCLMYLMYLMRRLRLLRSSLTPTSVLACGLLALSACRSAVPDMEIRSPLVTVSVDNLTPQEQEVVIRFFDKEVPSRWRATALGEGTGDSLTFELHLDSWAEHAELHARLIRLRAGPNKHLILQNYDARSTLSYTSSLAKSRSSARLTIAVTPADAELYFDSRLPAVNVSAAILTRYGNYEFSLPFSFIKENEYIYFHSIYRGQYRYYRYCLAEERQEMLPNVDSPEAFRAYLSGLR